MTKHLPFKLLSEGNSFFSRVRLTWIIDIVFIVHYHNQLIVSFLYSMYVCMYVCILYNV